ncbi:hypothetical protein IFM89_035190 [Coptis chinensis]|uniref:HIRAN domain-containing protein n=1 Tax=Coptis chinensis TaxID=261450 RepID=A0A835MB25_9MAGN|nr:hypothetical protein IFM89_035190 [Coptis chinensis]
MKGTCCEKAAAANNRVNADIGNGEDAIGGAAPLVEADKDTNEDPKWGGTAALLTYKLIERKEFSSTTCFTFAPEFFLVGFVVGRIVGLQHYSGRITGREMIGLVIETLNPYDSNAIKVLNMRSAQRYRLPRQVHIFSRIDAFSIVENAIEGESKVLLRRWSGLDFRVILDEAHVIKNEATKSKAVIGLKAKRRGLYDMGLENRWCSGFDD